ncbi:MAG: pyridoxal-dependent decarboxylase [Paracoccaceae bacterium]
MSDTLDPKNWDDFRQSAHTMLDAALDKMQSASDGPVWQPLPADMKSRFNVPLPAKGANITDTLSALLPYGVGNTHPRFFGWVHGAGTPTGVIADIAAGAMNANLGGRDHGAMYVEKQVVAWVRQMFDFPETASGLIVSGTSMATIIALKVARDARLDFASRTGGIGGGIGGCKLVGYTSEQAHTCVARAFDILGLGSDALRIIAVNTDYTMDIDALQSAIDTDRAAGLIPFFVAGTAGTVNTGAIDNLAALADTAAAENLWLHVDGAFGATAILSPDLKPKLRGINRADSIAFDFHKWLHVNYDAGFVLIRDEALHRAAFSLRPEYLREGAALAAGNPWPVEYGPELSRTNRALKIWAQFTAHGTEALAAAIARNCTQAQTLAGLIVAEPSLQLCAPVSLNIVCFSVPDPAQNADIVAKLQTSGIAAPSTTMLQDESAIRVNLTNHRTQDADLALLVRAVVEISAGLTSQ